MKGLLVLALVVAAFCIPSAADKAEVRCFQCQYIRMKRGSQPEVSKPCLQPDEAEPRLSRPCRGQCVKTTISNANMDYIERACASSCREGARRVTDYGEGIDHCCEEDFCNHSNNVRPSTVIIAIATCVITAKRFL